MKEQFGEFLVERQRWASAYDALLQFASEGVLEREILQAKEIFFQKLGRAHEMKEELYEAASQSFLEWYLWDYPTKLFGKSPAVVYLTLGLGATDDREFLQRSLFHHWSIFEVKSVQKDEVIVQDLLVGIEREVIIDPESPEARLWNVEAKNVVQTRLFPLKKGKANFCSHLWIHPRPEDEILKKLCKQRGQKWGRHEEFLLSSFETALRSLAVDSQIKAANSKNWLYQDLWKRYAQAS